MVYSVSRFIDFKLCILANKMDKLTFWTLLKNITIKHTYILKLSFRQGCETWELSSIQRLFFFSNYSRVTKACNIHIWNEDLKQEL